MASLDTLLKENTERILTCVHCGLCLPACPTYRELGNENDSPRGRVYLMRGVVESRLDISDAFISHIDLCLGCRACETVCPSGVPYGQLLEAARAEVAQVRHNRRSVTEFFVRLLLNRVFVNPALIGGVLRVSRWLRDSGLARLAFEADLLGSRVRFALALLLASAPTELSAVAGRNSENEPAAAEKRPSVALLKGCVMEGLFRHVNLATERVLEANGFELVNAPGQACCGALHAHAGYPEAAAELARRNIAAFEQSGCQRVVVNAAGCGAAMKEYAEWLSHDPALSEKAQKFSASVRDVSELLSEFAIKRPHTDVERNVAYDAACHLIHGQRIANQPVSMIGTVPGVRIVKLDGADTCCGGAGIYNIQHPELSSAILKKKLEAIASSGADLLATGNPGCIMQIGAGLLMTGQTLEIVHPVEILARGYCGEPLRSKGVED
jgi:glycolate oxidase iron-sulfur subunit